MTLPEVDDRLLALSEGEWMNLPMARSVLESWFDREFSRAELLATLGRLAAQGLVECRNFLSALDVAALAELDAGVEFIATPEGIDYLRDTSG